MLDALASGLFSSSFIHLFSTQVDPESITLVSQLTEATFPGYASQALDAWNAAEDVDANSARVVHAARVFTSTGGTAEVVWGYYVLGPLGEFLWFEQATNPVPISVSGFTHVVYPQYTMPFPPL